MQRCMHGGPRVLNNACTCSSESYPPRARALRRVIAGTARVVSSARKQRGGAKLCVELEGSAAETSGPMEVFGPSGLKDCDLVKTFFTRVGVLAVGAGLYVSYTLIRMRLGYDKRPFLEFLAMLFNLSAHQFVGGMLLLLYSAFQTGLEPLAWYSATFDFEFAFTMVYIKLVKSMLAPLVLDMYRRRSGVQLFLGQVGDADCKFRWEYFWIQFVTSVCVVGVASRVMSIGTISVLQKDYIVSFNAIRALAAFYAYLPLTCFGEALLTLYIKPTIVDALTFALSDWLLSSGKSRREPAHPYRLLE